VGDGSAAAGTSPLPPPRSPPGSPRRGEGGGAPPDPAAAGSVVRGWPQPWHRPFRDAMNALLESRLRRGARSGSPPRPLAGVLRPAPRPRPPRPPLSGKGAGLGSEDSDNAAQLAPVEGRRRRFVPRPIVGGGKKPEGATAAATGETLGATIFPRCDGMFAPYREIKVSSRMAPEYFAVYTSRRDKGDGTTRQEMDHVGTRGAGGPRKGFFATFSRKHVYPFSFATI